MEDYMTATEAAKELGVRNETISRLIKRGYIVAEKFGPIWKVDRASVEAYRQHIQGLSKNDPRRKFKREG